MENFFTIPWLRLFLLLFIVYLIIAVLMWFFGDRLVFPAPKPSSYSMDQVSFSVSIGSNYSIACMHLGERDKPKRTVIFSHGNGEDLGNLESFLSYFGSDSTEMIAYDYPGYGLSEGKPSEEGCYEAVEAVFAYVVNQLGRDPAEIIMWGRSLGTGPSLYLASRRKVGGLILETPFLSAFRSATGITMLPWDRFRNVDHTGAVNCSSLVIHGTLDEVVPFRQGREIFRQLPEPKKFFEVVRGKHNDLWEVGGSEYRDVLKQFIRSIGS
jgi:fermentation-respiration switch protein FrsA (DUF1100 family)